jgi:hypothetical protein
MAAPSTPVSFTEKKLCPSDPTFIHEYLWRLIRLGHLYLDPPGKGWLLVHFNPDTQVYARVQQHLRGEGELYNNLQISASTRWGIEQMMKKSGRCLVTLMLDKPGRYHTVENDSTGAVLL